jgi:hypothetical protein
MHGIFCTHYADWEWVLENKSVMRTCGTRENKQTNTILYENEFQNPQILMDTLEIT